MALSVLPPDRGLVPRGVYCEPYYGANGEVILVAITSYHRQPDLGRVVVPLGMDPFRFNRVLWVLLDQIDPVAAEEPPALDVYATLRLHRSAG